MRRPVTLALALAAALAAAGCSKSACQELGEKLCLCQPGMTQDTCKAQVQDQLNNLGVDTPGFTGMLDNVEAGQPATFEDKCQKRLNDCVDAQEAAGATDFCEFLLTDGGKVACGLSPPPPAAP